MPIDLTIERRLTQLETQNIEIYRSLSKIETGVGEIKSSVNTATTADNAMKSTVETLVTDVKNIKTQLEQLDTLSFFSKNPKMLLYVAIGAIVVLFPAVREFLGKLLLGANL